MASVVSEMGDSEVFDELPHWDDEEMFDGRSLLEVIWDREVSNGMFDERSAPAVIWDEDILSEHAAYNVFEEMPLKDNVAALLEQAMFSTPIPSKGAAHEVIWDEEPQQFDGEMGESLECKQVMLMAPIMSNSDVEGSSTVTGSSSLVNAEVHNIKTEDEEPQQFDGEMGESLECKQVMLMAPIMSNSDVEGSSTVTGSSSLVNAEVHNIKTEDETNRFSYVSGDEAGFVREAIAETEEEADAIVPFSEYTEETQFQFSDTENFADRKAMGNIVAKETAGEGNLDESDCDTEKQEGGDVDIANILESCSHIHDLGRSDRFELSYSLQSNAENNGFDPVKSTDSAFLEEKSEITGDSEEISLCRHLLSEGMGEDAACSAFYSEKITLEKFHTMKLSLTRNNKLVVRIVGRYFPWDAAVPIVLGLISFSEEQETYNLAIQTHQPNGQFGIGIPFGRVIVGCKPDKIEECLTKQLFGLPSANCADTDVAKASVIENSHSDTGKKESEEAVSNWENLDGNAVSLELGIDLPLFLHSGTAYGDELHSGTIVPTFWCMCFSVVKSANQVRVLMKKDSGDTMAVEERLIAVKVEWSPTVLFSPHFKLSWLDPNHKIASSVRMQWDPGIGTATAWGQAVFRGGGNVMTHICQERPKITKAHLPKLQPKKPKPSAPIEGTTSTSGQASNRIRYRTEKRRKPVAVFFLRHPTPFDFLCDQLTLPEFISPVSNGSLHGEPVRTRCE